MCGIVGVCNFSGEPVQAGLLKRMTDVIAHRGPDGEGQYTNGPVGLGHRRLAVIDLSPAGHQPMSNEAGDMVITYNGEVYNFRELRSELEALGHRFRSKSDSEVVLRSYEEWGAGCVERFNGMFAFAIYDSRPNGDGRQPQAGGPTGTLFLARDRYGIKPLYYYHSHNLLLFASEIKALLQHPSVGAQINYPALSEYFTYQNVFSDTTLFEGIRLLPPGCTITVTPGGEHPVKQERYWDYEFTSDNFRLSQEECAEELFRLFDQAVTRQLVSDVPVGSYLSGGMDSGSITAIASRHIPRIHTFSGGFDLSSATGLEVNFDERPSAELMANLFKTEHYEAVMHAGDMEQVLPDLIWHLEDLRLGQCYPNYYVARLASKFVKVVLSGGGGDELFAGYPWRYYRGLHAGNPGGYYRAYYDYWQRLVPDEDRRAFFNQRTYAKLADLDPFNSFQNVFSNGALRPDDVESIVNTSLYFEIKTFLHGLFVIEDKISMAHSLETRVPFMDNDLVDFALTIPPRYKLRDLMTAPVIDEDEPAKLRRFAAQPHSDGKLVLRNAVGRLLPSEITTRAKQGFSAPDASWFRGESVQYVTNLLGSPKALINDFFNPTYVTGVLNEHSSGKANHRLLIWSLLSFEWWLKVFDPKA